MSFTLDKEANKIVNKNILRIGICLLLIILTLGLFGCGSSSVNNTLASSGTASGVIQLPMTGQTKCYSGVSPFTEISCSGTGQDRELQKGVASPNPRFTVDTTANCVTDNLTGSMWSKDANMWGKLTWQSALDEVRLLNQNSSLCGSTDWRLANINELRSLVDLSGTDPAIQTGNPFGNVQSPFYWSSTTLVSSIGYAWVVHMGNGGVYTCDKTDIYYVWPVRCGE